jgi:N-acetylmuramoyl-L-alanine amidase
MKKIMIDPGHGGNDGGAVGNDLVEKNLTLDIAMRIGDFLSAYDTEIFYTRKTDQTVTLEQRSSMANELNVDFFLSIHINAANGKGQGFESYVYQGLSNRNTGDIQKSIHNHVMRQLNEFNVTDRGLKEANFHVLRETQMPAILLENLFIDHSKNAELLKDSNFIKELSQAIGEGLVNALSLEKKLNWKEEAVEWLFQEGLLTDEQWKARLDQPLPLWALAILLKRMNTRR